MFIAAAVRSRRRPPGFVAVALRSLAVGVGANPALHGLWNGVALRP